MLKKSPLLVALSAALPMTTVFAQSTEAPVLQSVTVTAQRRTENIKEVPVSVSILNVEKLDVLNSSGQDIRVLAGKVPSLNIESSNGRVFPRFYIRGYGNTDFNAFASQPVSLIYDDVVQENPILKGYPMFDLAGVEVLRGPQGTLFGRNTPAGVVKFDSAKPKLGKTEGYANASWATFNTTNLEAAANVPLSSEWALRASMLRQHRDNWVNNTFTHENDALEGYNEHAERVQMLYQPNAQFNALFNVHQRTTTGSARLFRANIIQKGSNELVPGFDEENISTNGRNYQHLKTNGANLRLSYDLGEYKLYSITGWEHVIDYYSRGDIDGGYVGGPGFVPFQVESAAGMPNLGQLSQEFRVESKQSGPLNWQAGLYYFDEDGTASTNAYNSDTGGQTTHLQSNQKNKAWAVFGSVNYNVSEALTVRGGLRYTNDKKDFRTTERVNVVQTGPDSVSTSASKVNWDLSATWRLNPNVNAFGRIATGFRAPSIAAASASVPITVADSETIVSYEAGVKADLFDKRARASVSLYDYQVKNQQLTVVGGNSNVTKLINAAKTDGRGVEFDFDGYLMPALRVSFGGSYNFTEIKDPSLSVNKCGQCTITDPINAAGRVEINGNPLPQAPKYSLNATAKYTWPVADGQAFVYTDWSYRSKVNFFLYEAAEFVGKPLTEGGIRVGYTWHDGNYEAAVYGRNITNQIRATGAIDFNNLTGFVNEPRIWGVQFKASF
ncbi:TonB-dependent receptor [Massilia arenosa]|uniref:TonB-dependent receptor n=1 Tax=Zemynaea arenosa TaxID=2561931 RepID=A0A4Y9S2B2_9BURK|nr:TonB-dependent receptor [Massilia arenosa]TFW15619.1 TonB-dependent receptor [Massilia arenosa]